MNKRELELKQAETLNRIEEKLDILLAEAGVIVLGGESGDIIPLEDE